MKNYGICPVCGTRLEVEDYFTEDEKKMTRDQLLAIMIQNFALDNAYPISIGNIAKRERVSYYQVRKYMHVLREEGLVVEQKKSIKLEDKKVLIQGWNITEKCKELEEFKKAKKYKEEIRGYEYVLEKRGKRRNGHTINR